MFAQQWVIPLEEQPTALHMGIAAHGNVPIERYQLDFWCLHLYQYTGELRIDSAVFPIRPGYASITPPRARLEFRYYGRSIHTYSHFACPLAQDGQIVVAAMQDLGSDFVTINQALEQAVGYWATNARRASVRLWDVLWRLTDARTTGPIAVHSHVHPAVEKALALIELRLGEPVRVADLAHEVGLSQNHLTRLFHSAVGKTVSGYIQERRVLHARHLLLHSTRSVKSIAAEVGIADLHLFNKTVRRALGASPRALREQADPDSTW